jgi:hypothetical protein
MNRTVGLASAALGLVILALACSDSSAPDPIKPPADLRVIQLPQTHPPLVSDTVSFMAVKGQNAQGSIFFAGGEGEDDDEYVRLTISGNSLLAYPDGTPMVDGDSVRITLRVVSSDSILFQFEPSGLAFDPDHPARLRIRYNQCNGDYNDDHHVDQTDAEILGQMAIWRQPLLSDPYTRLGSVRIGEEDGIEANLTGFSRYAIAY